MQYKKYRAAAMVALDLRFLELEVKSKTRLFLFFLFFLFFWRVVEKQKGVCSLGYPNQSPYPL